MAGVFILADNTCSLLFFLCIAKVLLLNVKRKTTLIHDQNRQMYLEWKAYRLCGIILIVMTGVLQCMVILIMKQGETFIYNDMLILVVALYDFCCLISSVTYMIRNRRKHTPVIVAIKAVSLAASCVSMLSLQTAMFASFGETADLKMQSIMNLSTGSIVCIILLVLGITMIVHAGRKMRELKSDINSRWLNES